MLGPLVVGDGGQVLGSTKERAIVELLALRAPHTASVDALVAAVWGERPPPSATKTLQSLVSRTRRALPELVIERVGDAYRVVADRIDAQEFELLVVDGRRALDDGDAEDAIEVLTAARRLWRGEPAPDLAEGPARAACTRLEEIFRTMVEDLNAARLEAGGDAALIADLEAALAGAVASATVGAADARAAPRRSAGRGVAHVPAGPHDLRRAARARAG